MSLRARASILLYPFVFNLNAADQTVATIASVEAERMAELDREIIDSRASTHDDHQALYRKLVTNVLLRSGMGSPTDLTVLRETTAALESVLPPVELGMFVSLPRREKKQQLDDLAAIVSGIRLFNKKCGKGGESIPVIEAQVAQTGYPLLSSLRDRATTMADAALAYVRVQMSEDERAPNCVSAGINARQLQKYMVRLHGEICRVAKAAEASAARYLKRYEILLASVQSKNAVPTDQVYPQFMELSGLYKELEGFLVFLTATTSTADELHRHSAAQTKFAESISEALNAAPQVAAPLLRVHALEQLALQTATRNGLEHFRKVHPTGEGYDLAADLAADAAASFPTPPVLGAGAIGKASGTRGKLTAVLPDVTHQYEDIHLSNGGFCVWAASKAPGPVLLPADRSIGLVRYDDDHIGLSAADAGPLVSSNVDAVLQRIIESVKLWPELIELLGMEGQFSAITPYGDPGHDSKRNETTKTIKCDSGAQTETHPYESNIDRSYEHSEWELRRKAIRLANLRQKRTHGVQTDRSNFRRDQEQQVYLPKVSTTQTRKDTGVNVPKPQTYIRGLRGPRGQKAAPVEVVDVTLGIGGVALNIRGLVGASAGSRRTSSVQSNAAGR